MKLYSWNVNGIRAVWSKGLFQKFIAQHDPDILCLQETKAQPHQSPIDMPQYTEYWNSAVKAGYSGTAIFSKVEPWKIINGFPEEIQNKYKFADQFGDPTKEGRVLSLRFKDFWVVTVYTPNSKRSLERLKLRHDIWDKAFVEHLQELEKDAPVLCSGDFNAAHTEIDLARPKDNEKNAGFTIEERKGIDDIIKAGFTDTFRFANPDKTDAYTWWTAWGGARQRNIGWRIDYWFASQQLKKRISNPQIHTDVMGSDHCPVSIEIDI